MSRRDSVSSPSRRQVLATAVGGGFALAVLPVSAETVTTKSDGLEAGEVRIPTRAGEIPAYRAYPAKGPGKRPSKKFPLLLVVHEIFGVHEHIKDVCRRLAKQGYFAVAPDLFARQGDVTKLPGVDDVRKVVDRVPDAQVLVDLDATVAWAGETGSADTTRHAITGFCWGGRTTWLYAAHSPTLKAGAAWYGRLVGEKSDLRPRQPVDVAGELLAPVLGLYGGQDRGIPLDTVEQMKKALAAGGRASRRSRIDVYPKAGHAFLADYRPSYDAQAAADAWRRMLGWFRVNGV